MASQKSQKSQKSLNPSLKHQKHVNGFKKHIENSLHKEIKQDKRINFILPQLISMDKNSDTPKKKSFTPIRGRIDHQNSAPLVIEQSLPLRPPKP